MKDIVGFIYVCHFDSPLKHAKHYVGWTENLESRIERHKNGTGSALMRAIKENNIGFSVASVFVGTRHDERRIKNQKNSKRFCKICLENEDV